MNNTKNFYKLESEVLECYDESVLIDYSEANALPNYIERIFQYHIQELIIQDILTSAEDETEEDLLDLVGNIDVSIPQGILNFYVYKALQ